MKKFFTLLTVVFALTLTVTSCTEEEVKPNTTTNPTTGGTVSAEKP